MLDCGANIGGFSNTMESKGAVVHGFEPAIAEFDCLTRNLEHPSSRAWRVAIGGQNKPFKLHGSNSGGNATLVRPSTPVNEGKDVKVTTLVSWPQESLPEKTQISVLKLEAEGAQGEVPRGLRKTLERRQIVCVDMGEFTGSSDNAVAEMTDNLYKNGFKLTSFLKARSVGVFIGSHPGAPLGNLRGSKG